LKFTKTPYFLLAFFVFNMQLYAQSYNAFNGSAYGGVFGVYNNPASTVNTAFNWDINLFSLQGQIANNVLKNAKPITANFNNTNVLGGFKSVFIQVAGDFGGLHIRTNITKKTAIAIGFKSKLFIKANTTPIFIDDTLETYKSFLFTNRFNTPLGANVMVNSWLQANFNIARTIVETPMHKLSFGLNIGYMKSIIGAYGVIDNVQYINGVDVNNKPQQIITNGNISLSYSQNLDASKSGFSAQENIKNIISQAHTNTSVSFGFEYLINSQSLYSNHPINTNYEWKIGISIMDIGKNTFTPAGGSFSASSPKAFLNTDTISKNIRNFESLKRYRDRGILPNFNDIDTLTANFAIRQPTRIVVSIDKSFENNYSINALLNFNLFNDNQNFQLATQNLSLITITPRWETKNKGYYFPIQFTNTKQFLVGAAGKIGPLLVGLHNIMWLFGGGGTVNGGGYIAFHLKPKYKEKDNSIKNPKHVL
jgi:hypothetical protein